MRHRHHGKSFAWVDNEHPCAYSHCPSPTATTAPPRIALLAAREDHTRALQTWIAARGDDEPDALSALRRARSRLAELEAMEVVP